MPCLPVSEFWQRSFSKYYKLTWIQNNGHHESKSYTFLVKHNIAFIVIASLVLYCFVLSIPLSTDITLSPNAITLYPPAFVIYQVLYTWLSYPCTVQILSIAFPTTFNNNFCRYILLPIPIFIGVTVLYIYYTSTGDSYTRTIGPFIQHYYVVAMFGIAVFAEAVYKYCKRNCTPDGIKETFSTVSFSMTGTTTCTNATCSAHALADNFLLAHDEAIHNKTHHVQQCQHTQTVQVKDCVHHKLRQFLFTVLVTAGITAVYYWCEFLTFQWNKHNQTHRYVWNELTNGAIFFYYPAFWVVINMTKYATTRCARYCDSNKYSQYSLELIMSYFFTCFYYVFYRNLFLHMGSYEYFVLVKLLHVALELVSYPLRMSRLYYNITDKLQDKYIVNNDGVCSYAMNVLYDPSLFKIWCVRISIDYAVTLIVSIGSAICYLVGVLWLRYGYNAYFYCIQDVSDEQFTKTLVFTAISIAVELSAYIIIEFIMRQKYQINVMRHWRALIRHRPGYIWYFVFMLQHVNTDVMIAKLQTN